MGSKCHFIALDLILWNQKSSIIGIAKVPSGFKTLYYEYRFSWGIWNKPKNVPYII